MWKRRLFIPTAAIALAFAACNDAPIAPDGDLPSFSVQGSAGTDYVLTAGRWSNRQVNAVRRAGGTVTWSHQATGIGVATSSDPNFLESAMASRAFTNGAADVAFEGQPPVAVAELDPAIVTPGDEGAFPFQWNMVSIDAPGAWATGADGSGARVAVIDGGINDTHVDLAGQVDAGCSTSFTPGQPFNTDVGFFWHGTHVAGIVAAADNGLGVIGVAPGATIMGVKIFHGGGTTFGRLIGGILFASDPGAFAGFGGCQSADIINMSLSAIFPKSAPGAATLVAALAQAVNFAASKGVLVLSAAANDGLDIGQLRDVTVVPAQSGSGLAVAATGPTGFINGATNYRRFASYSNWGEDLVNLAGPGGDFVDGPGFPFDMVLSLCGGLGGTGYCFAAGTSMATPAVAGVAALIVGNNPGISLGALKAKLQNSADDEGKIGKDEFYGHGFVNARRAVQ